MLKTLLLAALSSTASATELPTATPQDAWAVGGATLGGAVLGGAAGFGAGLGLAQALCSANGYPDGAWGCILASSTTGAILGYSGGAWFSGGWLAGRRGLDDKLVRRRTLITLGISYGVAATTIISPLGAPLGAAGLLVAVPVVAGRAVTHPRAVSVAPMLGREEKGVVAHVRF